MAYLSKIECQQIANNAAESLDNQLYGSGKSMKSPERCHYAGMVRMLEILGGTVEVDEDGIHTVHWLGVVGKSFE